MNLGNYSNGQLTILYGNTGEVMIDLTSAESIAGSDFSNFEVSALLAAQGESGLGLVGSTTSAFNPIVTAETPIDSLLQFFATNGLTLITSSELNQNPLLHEEVTAESLLAVSEILGSNPELDAMYSADLASQAEWTQYFLEDVDPEAANLVLAQLFAGLDLTGLGTTGTDTVLV